MVKGEELRITLYKNWPSTAQDQHWRYTWNTIRWCIGSLWYNNNNKVSCQCKINQCENCNGCNVLLFVHSIPGFLKTLPEDNIIQNNEVIQKQTASWILWWCYCFLYVKTIPKDCHYTSFSAPVWWHKGMSVPRQKCLKGHDSEISARFCAKNVDCASHRDLKCTAHITIFMVLKEFSNAHPRLHLFNQMYY